MAFAIRHRPNHDLIDPPRFSKQPASLDAHPRKQRSGFSSQRNVLDIAGGECWTGRVLLGRFFSFCFIPHVGRGLRRSAALPKRRQPRHTVTGPPDLWCADILPGDLFPLKAFVEVLVSRNEERSD